MAAQSTMRFAVLGAQSCTLAHPWTDSCLRSYFQTLGKALMHTAAVFAPLYCLPAASKIIQNGVDRDEIQDALISSIRTILYVSINVSLACGLNCFARAIVGSFKQYSTAFIPSVFGALGILCEDRKKWNGAMVMIGNMLLERLLLLGQRATGVAPSPALLTALFMATSGPLLFLLRRPDFRCLMHGIDSPWFFYPTSVKDGSQSEKQESSTKALKRQLQATARLAGAGVALQVARLVVKNVNSPSTIANQLSNFQTYSLGLFLGCYSIIYKVCCWALERWRGRDAAWHALPAGLLAGAALRLYPRRLLALMAPTTLLQVLIKWICNKKKVKHVLLWKFIFVSISTGYLVHIYFVDPFYTPVWFSTLLNAVTGGMTGRLQIQLLKSWHTACFPIAVAGL